MPTNSPLHSGRLLTATHALAVALIWATACGPKTPASSPAPPLGCLPAPADSATPHNFGGFYFVPQGADFTLWVNHLKDEVYRNWIMPQPALLGYRGHVDFEFTVEREGEMSALRMLKSSGNIALDRAAKRALSASCMKPLPDDYDQPN